MKVVFLLCHVSTCVAQLPPSVSVAATTTIATTTVNATATTVKAEPTTTPTPATTTVNAVPTNATTTTTHQRSRFGNEIPKDKGCLSAEDQAELCREQYVDPKDCAKWIGPCNKFHYEIPKDAGCMSAEDQAELCRENYVDQKACAKWVGPCNNASSAILVTAEQEHQRLGYDIPKDAGCMSAEDQAELCREQYVDPKDCAKWVGPCNKFNYTVPEHAGCLSAEDQAELCRENYVDEEDCAKWVGPCDNLLAEMPQGLPFLLLAAGGAGALAAVAVNMRRERRAGPSEPLLPSDILL